jgi:hypothetical protein
MQVICAGHILTNLPGRRIKLAAGRPAARAACCPPCAGCRSAVDDAAEVRGSPLALLAATRSRLGRTPCETEPLELSLTALTAAAPPASRRQPVLPDHDGNALPPGAHGGQARRHPRRRRLPARRPLPYAGAAPVPLRHEPAAGLPHARRDPLRRRAAAFHNGRPHSHLRLRVPPPIPLALRYLASRLPLRSPAA